LSKKLLRIACFVDNGCRLVVFVKEQRETLPECRSVGSQIIPRGDAGWGLIYLTQINSLFVSVLNSIFVILGLSWL